MIVLLLQMASCGLQKSRELPKAARKPTASKRQKLASLHKFVPLMPVFCQALLQRREDIFKSQEAHKECLRMSWLLNTCGQQTELLEVLLIRRNYDKNNKLKLRKGSQSPFAVGVYGHRIFFNITLCTCAGF